METLLSKATIILSKLKPTNAEEISNFFTEMNQTTCLSDPFLTKILLEISRVIIPLYVSNREKVDGKMVYNSTFDPH